MVPSYPQPLRPSITALCSPNSKLRPALDSEKKSRLLSTCLHSVLALPLLDVLEKHTCLFLEPPNVQVRTRYTCARSPRGALSQGIQLGVLPVAGERPGVNRAPAVCRPIYSLAHLPSSNLSRG